MFGIFAHSFMTATRTGYRDDAGKPRLRLQGALDPFLRRMPFETLGRR